MGALDALLGGKSTDYVTLSVNGEAFSGFASGSIQLTMREGANSFDCDYVADDKSEAARAIFEGDEVEISIDAGSGPEKILIGYVDEVTDDDDADGLRLSVAGRSRTGELVDCSAGFGQFGAIARSWKNVDIEKIAGDICAPFSIDVVVAFSQMGPKFPTFAIQRDERAFDAIARAALKRGLFPYCVAGDLILASAGETQTSTVLARGDRVIRTSRTGSWLNRYSDYIFRAQARPTDNNFGAKPAQLKSAVLDAGINRFRPLSIQADASDGVDLKTRANLERNQRAGNGEHIVALVDGWQTDEGNAWRPNTLVRFKNEVLGVDADLLITTVRFRFGANEAREVELEMTRPEAFTTANYPPLARGESWT